MSGHSHWAGIKHQKAINDAKRGKLFSKLGKTISVAAREKGRDETMNPKLRLAVEKAHEANMPKENIERAVKRGTGELEGATLEEITLEIYGPEGIAILVEGITDNKNRTLSEIKKILSLHNAKLATEGSVKWAFTQSGGEWIPKFPMEVSSQQRETLKGLFEALDDYEDVQEIYSNLK